MKGSGFDKPVENFKQSLELDKPQFNCNDEKKRGSALKNRRVNAKPFKTLMNNNNLIQIVERELGTETLAKADYPELSIELLKEYWAALRNPEKKTLWNCCIKC